MSWRFWLVLICLASLALWLCSCGDEPRGLLPEPKPTPPTPSQDLTSLGRWLIWSGGGAAAVTLIAFVFTRLPILVEAILAGLAVCLLGIVFSWLGQHPIAIWCVVATLVFGAVYRYRRQLRRLLVGPQEQRNLA